MAGADPWAGMVNPRAALKAARDAAKTLADFSRGGVNDCESGSLAKTETCADFSSSSNFSRPPRELSHSSGKNPKDRKETCSSSLSEGYAISGPSAGEPEPGFALSDARAAAKAAKPLESGSTRSDRSIIALAGSCESFAVTNAVPGPMAHLSGPREWIDGLARLDIWQPPCPGFRSGEWQEVERTVRHFMDHCAVEAAARGWTALDLFGVHRAAGAAAVDNCGALMLPGGGVVTSVSVDAIAFGNVVYRKRPLPQAVRVWDFSGEAI